MRVAPPRDGENRDPGETREGREQTGPEDPEREDQVQTGPEGREREDRSEASATVGSGGSRRAGPERPGPEGREREDRSEASATVGSGGSRRAGPERPGPEGREREDRSEAIDPRIRARRIAVVREQGQRRLRLILFVVAFLGLLGVSWLAVESPALDVDHIEVEGTRGVAVSDAVVASGIRAGDALTFVDTGTARDRVEALPRIASAEVSRSFPGTVRLSVIEREPAAWISVPVPKGAPPGPVVFVDARGRVIEEGSSPAAGLPEIRGLGPLPEVGARVRPVGAVTLLGALPDALRRRVATVTIDDFEATLGLHEREGGWPSAESVRLGAITDVRAKGIAALAVLDALDDDVGYLDVRVPSAPATGEQTDR